MTGLYNVLFGRNPFEAILLKAIGVKIEDIPRYRDCYLTDSGDIVIYTRTGGGNREFYERPVAANDEAHYKGPWNENLRANPNFLKDEDDTFDCTYAYFHYRVPKENRSSCDMLMKLGAIRNPSESWHNLINRITHSAKDDPEMQRALEVVRDLLKGMSKP